MSVLYEMIDGKPGYSRVADEIWRIVTGHTYFLIGKRSKTAGQMRIALKNIAWGAAGTKVKIPVEDFLRDIGCC